MNKILVTIDFSSNSRKTIRFAIQLASQSNAEIIFLHLVNFMTPLTDAVWDYSYYSQFQNEKILYEKNRLAKLIKEVYTSNLPKGVKYKCECQLGSAIGEEIILYAKNHNIDFICVGARGTGIIAKLFGTVAKHLITKSPIPVFVIPKNYRLKPLTKICYASDMQHLEPEIKKVIELSNSLRAAVKILHFDYETGLIEHQDQLTAVAKKYETRDIKFQYKKLDAIHPLQDHLQKAILVINPSLAILFTEQNKKWIDHLLLPSETTALSFTTKVPLLVYRKERK